MSPRNNNKEEFSFNEDRPFIATDRNVAIPLWVVIAMVIFFIGGTATATFWMANQLNSINNKLDYLSTDRWKLSYQREWGYRLDRANKGTVTVPDADDIAIKMK